MLVRELLPLFEDVTTIVEVSESGEALREPLRAPDGVAYRSYAAGGKLDAATLVVASVGPESALHVEAAAIAPALRDLPVGGRAVLLLGWPVPDLPYHQVLDELIAAGCQVLQVIPLDNAAKQQVYCAVVAARVDRLLPLRPYLSDEPVVLDGATPDLRALLRLTGEQVFRDLLDRPLRHRLSTTAERVAEQDQRIAQLEKDLVARDAAVADAERRLAKALRDNEKLRASTVWQVGTTVVQGARRPGKAIVSVPTGLVRIWRQRGASDGSAAK